MTPTSANATAASQQHQHPPLIHHLISSHHISPNNNNKSLLVYHVPGHPIIEYVVVHEAPLQKKVQNVTQKDNTTTSTTTDAKTSAEANPIQVPSATNTTILPPIFEYSHHRNVKILFIHISYFQHCLNQQDLFASYILNAAADSSGNQQQDSQLMTPTALKEDILLRKHLDLILMKDSIINSIKQYGNSKAIRAPPQNLPGNSSQTTSNDSWFRATLRSALETMDMAYQNQAQQQSNDHEYTSLVSLLDAAQPEEDLSFLLPHIEDYPIPHQNPNISVKQLVLQYGVSHLRMAYGIQVFWPWKDLDLIVCTQPTEVSSQVDSSTVLKQSRCIVMDHNSIIRAITHERPTPLQLGGIKSTKKKSSTSSGIYTENDLASKLKEALIMDNTDGFLCTIFYEQGEWLVVSQDAFNSRFQSEKCNSDPLFVSNPSNLLSAKTGEVHYNANFLGSKQMSEMFWFAFYEHGYNFPEDKRCCYTFVLQLSQYPKHLFAREDQLHLVSAHRIESTSHFGEEQQITELDLFQVARELKYDTPKIHSFASLELMKDSLMDLNPLEQRGYIVLLPQDDASSSDQQQDALQYTKRFDRVLLDSPQFTACKRLKDFHTLSSNEQNIIMYDLVRSGYDDLVMQYVKFSTTDPKLQSKARSLHARTKQRLHEAAIVVQQAFDGISSKQKKAFTRSANQYPFSNVLMEMRSKSHTNFLTQYLKYDTSSHNQLQNLLKKVEKYHSEASRQHFDYLVVIDLEATCDRGSNPKITSENQEIIEFPIVVLDLSREPTAKEAEENNMEYNIIYKAQHYVKPEWSKSLTAFCTQLTGITWEKLRDAPDLEETLHLVDNELKSVIPKDKKMCVITDGKWDMQFMLMREASAKGIVLPEYYYQFFNLKEEVKNEFPKLRTKSLKQMTKQLGVQIYGHHHCGLDDCITITRVINALRAKKEHQFTNPIIVEQGYDPRDDLTFVPFSERYVPGEWTCWKCTSVNADDKYSCTKCHTKRPTADEIRAQRKLTMRIEKALQIPKTLSSTSKHAVDHNKNTGMHTLLLRLVKSGFLGSLFFLVMRRLEPRRRKFWLFVASVLGIISYLVDWPRGAGSV